MESIPFRGMNKTLGAPSGMEAECNDLNVYADEDACLSCWQLDQEELAELQKTGRIWLWVHTQGTQPPVSLQVEDPFDPANHPAR